MYAYGAHTLEQGGWQRLSCSHWRQGEAEQSRYNQMAKMLGRQSIKDALLSESDAFLADLLSENNPDAQRIDSYLLDDKSGNTPALGAQGVWIIRHKVFMLQTLDVIVAQSEIGPGGINVTAS